MIRSLFTALLLSFAVTASAQTVLHLSNITLTTNGHTERGADVTASLRGDQGNKAVTIYADQRYSVDGRFKVKTHNVHRQSAKQGAVYLTLYMTLKADGKRNKRVVQKTFYAEQDRSAQFSEAFTIKHGIDVRKITVSFEGRIQ